jgi:phosphatidylinositol alpha-1,6-mannosyltransferase
MKILFLTDNFLPHAGGARVYYYHLYKNLSAEFGHDVTILTRKVDGSRSFDAAEATALFRITRRGAPLPNWKWNQWPKLIPVLADTARIFQQLKPDVLHFGDLFPQGVVCLLMNRLFGIPYVAYCHGEEITQTDLRRYQPVVRNAIFQHATTVIAASEFARENLRRIGIPEAKIRKINPGVEWDRFCPAPKNPTLLQKHSLDGKQVLLTVSRLVPRKGHAAVMQALVKILPEAPDTRYLIVGKGPEEARLRRTAEELGISHAVVFAGFVPDCELPDYYNLGDIFVMPNSVERDTGDMEGFGMVFLEANAAGKPVVAGRSGGTAESVLEGVTGYRVTPEEPEELAQVLSLLLRNPDLRHRLGAAGVTRVQTDFDWRRGARLLHEISAGPSVSPHLAFAARR